MSYPDSAPGAEITDEMYNLIEDPIEAKNLSISPEYSQQKKKMLKELENLKNEFGYRSFSFDDIYEQTKEK